MRRNIATTIVEFINEQTENNDNMNDNFREWFGDSKAVDKDGNPITCYHGTDAEFDTFSKEKIGYNHWQSRSNSHGGGIFFTDKKSKVSRLGIIMEVYLKIENPLIREFTDAYGYEADYYNATDMYDDNSDSFLREASVNGNDGIIMRTPRGSLYVVFEPNQIKATGNDGSWDAVDENIYS